MNHGVAEILKFSTIYPDNVMEDTKITKEQFDRLLADDLMVKEKDFILSLIDKRFGYIMKVVQPNIINMGWFDYANCNYEGEESGGYFDIDKYLDTIPVGGEGVKLPSPYSGDIGENWFPTRWLWEDFEEEFKAEVKLEKERKKQERLIKKDKREKRNKEKSIAIKSIKEKLTEKELEFVKFK